MKKFHLLTAVVCAGIVSLTSGVAQSSVTVLGSSCVEQYPSNIGVLYTARSVSSPSYSVAVTVTCPIAVDHDIGNRADFEVVVIDRDSDEDDDFSCFAIAYDGEGALQGISPAQSTSESSSSATKLEMAINGVNPGADWAFAIVCSIPGSQSELLAMRAF